jgi:hypothetical protein
MSESSSRWLVYFGAILAVVAIVIWLLVSAGWQLGWWLLGGFLFCHGWVHMFVVLPPQVQAAAAGRRIGLTASETRAVTLPLIAVAAVGFMLAGMATIMGSNMWGFLVLVSSLASLALLAFYFSRLLILGLVIDAAFLAIVVTGIWRP